MATLRREALDRLHSPLGISENDRLFISLEGFDHFIIRIASAVEGGFASYPAREQFIQRIPEKSKGDAWNKFKIAATDFNVAIIHAVWPACQIEFADVDAKIVYAKLLGMIKHAAANAKRTAEYFENGTVPEHKLVLHPEYPLTCYQQVALVNGFNAPGYALFMEQGTGKTAIPITAVCNHALQRPDDVINCLVICPKNVRLNWEAEFRKFSTVPVKTSVIRGWDVARLEQFIKGLAVKDERVRVFIMNYRTFCNSYDFLQLDVIDWDVVILDEAHNIKNSKTDRWKWIKRARDISKQCWALTGTPITNTVMDLWTQLEFCGNGFSGFISERVFRDFYGVYERNEEGFDKLVSLQNLPIIKDRLTGSSFIIRKEQAIKDLPEKLYDIEEIEMTKEQEKFYIELSTKLVVEIERDIERAEESANRALVVNNILTKLLKLAQVTSGFYAISEERDEEGNLIYGREEIRFMRNPKIDALLEILKAKKPNEKTLVWACFINNIKLICEVLTREGFDFVSYYGSTSEEDRAIAVERFNADPACKIFVGNPSAGGAGLNLLGYVPERPDDFETNCTHSIYFSQDWKPAPRWQSEDRNHRKGTRVPIQITDLVVPGTIDEEIRARIVEKKMRAFEVSDLKDMLRSLVVKMK